MKRQPSIRELREIIEALHRHREETGEDNSFNDLCRAIEEQFPICKAKTLDQALEFGRACKKRASHRFTLEAARTEAVMKVLERGPYMNLNEAMQDLGFLDIQEVHDWIMAEAKLPPSEAPEFIQIGD